MALFEAIAEQSVEKVIQSIKEGSNVNEADENGTYYVYNILL